MLPGCHSCSGDALEAAFGLTREVFGIGVLLVAGVAVIGSTPVPDRQAARRGRVLACQALTGACVLAIAAAIVLAIYVMADK